MQTGALINDSSRLAQRRVRMGAPLVVALAAALTTGGALLYFVGPQHAAPLQSLAQASGWFTATTPGSANASQAAGVNQSDQTTGRRTIRQIEEALLVNGSLRGVDLPPWGSAPGQPVQPNRALRDRFDFYLLGMGEASLAELTALVHDHALRDLGLGAARTIDTVWSHYLRLQQHAFTHAADPADLASMQAALQEHQQVRQQLLGIDWARAFYVDEEARLTSDIDRAMRGLPAPGKVDLDQALFSPPQGADPDAVYRQRVERFGKEKAQRLQELDLAEAAWAQRIEHARAQVQSVQHDAQLSTPQRQQAIDALLSTAFADPAERVRAIGLLGL